MDTDKVPGKLRLRSEKAAAFTLMEVVVAVMVLTTISTVFYLGLSTCFSVLKTSREDIRATQIMMQKLDLLSSLINSELLSERAEKLGLTATDADVETEFNKMKAPYTKEEFDRQLAARKMTVDDLKSQLRHDLTIQKLVNKEITSRITITDADVANFYNANKASFNLAEPQIHMAQIVVTKNPDPNVRNLKNSKAQNEKEARAKIEGLAAQLRQVDLR